MSINLRKLKYVIPNRPKFKVGVGYIYYDSIKYKMLIDIDDELELDCQHCAFCENRRRWHTCPDNDPNFDWNCCCTDKYSASILIKE